MTSHWGRPGTPLASTQVRAPSAELTLTPPASAPRTGDADLPAGCACTPLQQSVDAGTVKFANPKQSLAEVSSWPTAGTQARILNARCRCEAVIRSHNPNITPRSIATFGLSHVAASFHPNAWHQPQAPARHVSEFSGHTVEGPANFHAWSALGFVAH